MKKKRQERYIATHARIIDAAVKLFGEKGVEEATIDQIVAMAGVSKGAFFVHFDSKFDVLVTVRKQLLANNKRLSELNPMIKYLQRNRAAFAYVDVSLELNRQRRSAKSTSVSTA